MKKLYDWILSWADKPGGGAFLFIMALVESFIFPIPPDALLIALCLGMRAKSFRFALICTSGSLIGAAVGYGIGYELWWSSLDEYSSFALWFFEHVPGFHEATFLKVKSYYDLYDVWIVFAAAFTPLPFKVVTITAGAFKIQPVVFLIGSTVGRALRFYLVAFLMWKYGERVKVFIDKYFNLLTILFLVLLVGGFVALKFLAD